MSVAPCGHLCDEEGYHLAVSDWSLACVDSFAVHHGKKKEEMPLKWILLARGFYDQFEISPSMRLFLKYVKGRLPDNEVSSRHFMVVFPEANTRQLCLWAGLPKPTRCL
jgi:tRNA 2-thiouridine synthesizing protein E